MKVAISMFKSLLDDQLAERRRALNRIAKRKSRQRQHTQPQSSPSAKPCTEIGQVNNEVEEGRLNVSKTLNQLQIPMADLETPGNRQNTNLGQLMDDWSLDDANPELREYKQALCFRSNSFSNTSGVILNSIQQEKPGDSTSLIQKSEPVLSSQQLQEVFTPSGRLEIESEETMYSFEASANTLPPSPMSCTNFEIGTTPSVESLVGKNTLHILAERGSVGGVEFVISQGIDVNEVDLRGYTALHLAILNGHESVAELLLQRGADVEKREPHGKTSLHLAALYGHEKLLEMVINYGADPSAVVMEPTS